jgi:hypothetical protein
MYLYSQPAKRRAPLGRLQTSAKRRRRGLGGLGVSSTLVSPQSYCASSCKNTQFIQAMQESISQRLLLWPPLPGQANCTSAPSSSTAQKVTAIAGTGVGATVGVTSALTAGSIIGASAATAAIPIVGAIVAPILAIVGTIFANHAKAVQLQSNVLCENVPAANAALQQIDAGLSSGTITAAQASTAYSQMQTAFTAAMKSDPSYKTGDALWGYNQILQAVLAQRMLDLQADGSSSGTSLLSSSGISPLYLLGGAALLWLLL